MGIFDSLFKKKSSLYEFIRDENGVHQIGGDKPDSLTIPEHSFTTDFQYLGFINPADPLFSWVPFRVHLTCPIYLDIDKVYLDYADPNAPQIISPVDTAAVTDAYGDLDRNSVIIYEAVRVRTEAVENINDMHFIGVAGQPSWIQASESPRCPKSNKPMTFLCQLSSFGKINARVTNVDGADFGQMTFWGDGDLYIFLEPESKTVCYFIQHT